MNQVKRASRPAERQHAPHSFSCRSRSLVTASGPLSSEVPCSTIARSCFSRRWNGARSDSLYTADSFMWFSICWGHKQVSVVMCRRM